jgi:hypothetical protein
MPEPTSLRDEILELLRRGMHPLSDDDFDWLALSVFRFQFENNPPYRSYCERRQATPATIGHWLEIPALPTAAFKEARLVAGDATRAQAVFRTSGTTLGAEKRGAHYVLDLELYRQSLLPVFQHFVSNDLVAPPMLSLVPAWQTGSDSSLAYMVTTVMRELGAADSAFGIDHDGIAANLVRDWLNQNVAARRPVCLIGTSLAFVHWFEQLRQHNVSFVLPEGSRLMDTGGFKGAQISISSRELRAQYQELLGIPAHFAVNEYGMTEMLSQFYDAHLRRPELALIKQGPPWVRSAVVDPETLQPLPRGERGLLRHLDLANLFSVAAIQTEDIAVETDAGFQLLGRAATAAPRGCSIAMDIFLSSTP